MRHLIAMLALVLPSTALADELAAPSHETLPEAEFVTATDLRPALIEVEPVATVEPKRRKIRGIPLRLDTRVVLRGGMLPGAALELGTQVLKREKSEVDLNLAYIPNHALSAPGPWRYNHSIAMGADWLFRPSDFFAFGPTAGVSYVQWMQQWTVLENFVVPYLGGRASASLIRTRTWSVDMTVKGQTDLVFTQLVLENNEIRSLNPFEAQAGMRLTFGHGRVKAKH